MASTVTSAELDVIVTDAVVINRIYVAALAFILYDHGLTLDDEVRHMWHFSRLEIGKILFFLNRYGVPLELIPTLYVNLIEHPTEQFCNAGSTFEQFASLASMVVVQICLLLRTWILWGAKRRILVMLSVYLISCCSASAVVLVMTGTKSNYLIAPSLTLTGCDNITPAGDTFWTVWIPIISWDLALCAMAIYKVVEHKRAHINGPVINLLHRDGLTYFALSLSLSTLNLLLYAAAPSRLQVIGMPLLTGALCTACSRMLLNVRATVGEHRPLLLAERSPPVGYELEARA